jgi:hypothetical protein
MVEWKYLHACMFLKDLHLSALGAQDDIIIHRGIFFIYVFPCIGSVINVVGKTRLLA